MNVDVGPSPWLIAVVVLVLAAVVCVASTSLWSWRPEAQSAADYERAATAMRVQAEAQRLADEAAARQYNQSLWEQVAPALAFWCVAIFIAATATLCVVLGAEAKFRLQAAARRPVMTAIPAGQPSYVYLPDGRTMIHDPRTGRLLEAGTPAGADQLTAQTVQALAAIEAMRQSEHGRAWLQALVDQAGAQLTAKDEVIDG